MEPKVAPEEIAEIFRKKGIDLTAETVEGILAEYERIGYHPDEEQKEDLREAALINSTNLPEA
jgi:hypothetical protein